MLPLNTFVRAWSAISHSLPQPAARRAPGARSRLARVCTIERLEDRVVPSTILVTSLADSGRGTLRAAIELARNRPSHLGGRMHSNTIKFARSVRGTIALTTALPILANDIVISGPGSRTSFPTGPGQPLTVTRSDAMETAAFSIFTVAKGAVISMRGLTITGGSAPDGGGIDNAGSLSLVDITIVGNSATSVGFGSPAATLGGGIDNTGTLSVAGSAFYDNSAAGGTNGTGVTGYGGAIANSGRLSVANSTFVGNSATDGGGIMNSGTASITGSQFSYDSASGGSDSSGGAIDNKGTLSVANCDFTSDTATVLVAGGSSFGGAIASSGTLSVSLSEFLGNVASSVSKSYGGAIHNSGTMSVTSSSFDSQLGNGTDRDRRQCYPRLRLRRRDRQLRHALSDRFHVSRKLGHEPRVDDWRPPNRRLWLWGRDQQFRHALRHQLHALWQQGNGF